MKKFYHIYPSAAYPFSVTQSIYRAKDFMNEHIDLHLSLKKLAKRVGTNEYTLKNGFKDIFNCTVYQYLLHKRMEHAFKLLTESNQKESAIASHCGFKTLAGFVTAFHKYFGQRPTTIRKFIQPALYGNTFTNSITSGTLLENLSPVA